MGGDEKVIGAKTYKFGRLEIIDNGDGKFGRGDRVRLADPKGEKGHYEMSADQFLSLVSPGERRRLVDTAINSSAFAKNIMRLAPSSKEIAALHLEPNSMEELERRKTVRRGAAPYIAIIDVYGTTEKMCVEGKGGYTVSTADMGAIRYLMKKGYYFAPSSTMPGEVFAYPEEAVNAAKGTISQEAWQRLTSDPRGLKPYVSQRWL
jgi:hypothetical protein